MTRRPRRAERAPRARLGGLTLLPFAIALLFHAGLVLQYRADPFSEVLVSDAASYDEMGRRIAEQGLAAEPVFHQAPLYPALLGWLYRSGGESGRAGAAIAAQAVLTSAAIAALVPIGLLFFGSARAGLLAAALALLHGAFVFHSLKVLPVALAIATQAALLVTLGLARERPSALLGALAGLAAGLAVLARAELLLYVPIAAAALALVPRCGGTRRGRPAIALLAFLVTAAATISPATLHNARRGDSVLVASSAGENLFLGNQRGADGGHTPLHPQAGDLFSQRALAEELAEEAAGRDLTPSEVSSYWRSRAIDEIAASPLDWLRLEARKAVRIFHPADPADMYALGLERGRYLPLLWLAPLPAIVLWLLAAGGAAIAVRRDLVRSWPLVGFLVVQLVVLLAFFVSTRLRLPALFVAAALGGYALDAALAAWRRGAARRPLAAAAVLLIALVAITPFAFPPPAREVVRLASVLSRLDRLDEALAVLEPVTGRRPDALALDQAGWVLSKRGEWERAREKYREALALGLPGGRAAQTWTRLAWCEEKLGDVAAAGRSHDAAVADERADAGSWYERGAFRARAGDLSGAAEDFRHAARMDPRWPAPREALRALGASD